MKIRSIFCLVVFCLMLPTALLAQRKSVVWADAGLVATHCPYAVRAADSTRVFTRTSRCVERLRAAGYLDASIDSIVSECDRWMVYAYTGKNYANCHLFVPDTLLPLIEVKTASSLQGGLLPVSRYPAFAEHLLTDFENNGYPFAEVTVAGLNWQRDTVGVLHIERNALIRFDSIILKGNLKLSYGYLSPFLGWKRNKRYDERVAVQVPARTKSLPFASETLPPGVEFVGDKAYLYLFLDKKRVNQFDGYIGLVPVSENTGKTMFTGEVNLHLQNIFTLGETFDLQWKAPAHYSQFLFLQADFPYLFRLPIGAKGTFTLDKKDTAYLNMNYLLALKYSFAGTNYLQAYYDYQTSRVLSAVPNGLQVSDTLLGDYRRSMYGFEFGYRKLDDVLQPRKGFILELNLSAGSRRLSPSVSVVSAEVQLPVYRLLFSGNGYFSWKRRWGAVVGINGAWQSGRASLFNELLRFGGATTLQGFDELSLSASSYLVALAELRFWFADYSYLNVFVNGAWYERRMTTGYFADYPIGIGAGVTLSTKAGIFYLNYALGQQRNSPFSFKTGKIHFGLRVRF